MGPAAQGKRGHQQIPAQAFLIILVCLLLSEVGCWVQPAEQALEDSIPVPIQGLDSARRRCPQHHPVLRARPGCEEAVQGPPAESTAESGCRGCGLLQFG